LFQGLGFSVSGNILNGKTTAKILFKCGNE